jgi:ligand-binding sensor domain-containing protein/DNA-binding CsgD family transcriptional regulator
MYKSFYIGFILSMLVLNSGHVYAQAQSFYFEQINSDDIPKNNKINDFIKDRNGFIWFATNGLYRFDGARCKYFGLSPKNSKYKHNVDITCLTQTNDGNFILGTANHGLYIFDPVAEKSRPYSSPSVDSFLFTTTVNCMFIEKNKLYIGTNAGLYKSNLGCTELIQGENYPVSEVYKIYKATDGLFWVCTFDRGLLLVDFEKNKVTGYKPFVHPGKMINSITAITNLNDSMLFVGTWGYGLFSFNLNTKQFKNIKGPENFNRCVVRDLAYSVEGGLWIATFAEGLVRYSLTDKTFTSFKAHPTEQNSLTNNTILRVYEDNSGILWVGPWGGYVCRLDLYAAGVCKLDNNFLNLLNNVSYLLPEPDGTLWASSYNDNLIEIQPDMKGYRSYGVPRLNNILINALTRTKDGSIWVGSCNGLNKISHNRTSITAIDMPDKQHTSVSAFFVDSADNIWMGADAGKVYIYDYRRNHFDIYAGTINPGYIYDIYAENSNVAWLVGTNGLFKLDREQQKILSRNYYNPKSNATSVIRRILPAKNGNLLLATENNGLWEYKRDVGSFTHLAQYGQVGVICDMKFDSCSILWMATSSGLFSYNPKTSAVRAHAYQQGIPETSFTSVCLLNNGMMAVGGNGLFLYDPYYQRKTSHTSPLVFTDLFVMDKMATVDDTLNGRVLLTKNIANTSKIELKYSENIFTLNFALLDYVNSRAVDYRYKLKGFDKEWHYTNADKAFATYTNLDAGKYTLVVEATDVNKQWIVPSAQIEIVVVPPFWRTIWFKLLLIVVVCWLAYSFYRQKIAVKQKEVEKLKNEKLQAEIKTNEEILSARNSELTSSVVHLSNKNEILQEIKRDLRSIKYITDINDITKTLNRINAHIDRNFIADNNWEQFEIHFNQLNHNFLEKLKKEFPDLTQTNLKLCAYLRMNLGSKEIASLMNISPNAVLKSKYRLKLKFQLNKEQDLVDFLSDY